MASGTIADRLAKLVQQHADYEFEGFTWLRCTQAGLADHLVVTTKTIGRTIAKPPFRHRVCRNKEYSRITLLRIGTELCESDHVFILREIWAKGLVYYNAALIDRLTPKVMYLKSVGTPQALYERQLHRIEAARVGAKDVDKLRAGGKISTQVERPQMGQLRGIVQALGEDSPDVLAHLVTFDGWHSFAAVLKHLGRLTRHYHWPHLPTIKNNPDIALESYLDALQAEGKVGWSESKKLLDKIETLNPGTPDVAA